MIFYTLPTRYTEQMVSVLIKRAVLVIKRAWLLDPDWFKVA